MIKSVKIILKIEFLVRVNIQSLKASNRTSDNPWVWLINAWMLCAMCLDKYLKCVCVIF